MHGAQRRRRKKFCSAPPIRPTPSFAAFAACWPTCSRSASKWRRWWKSRSASRRSTLSPPAAKNSSIISAASRTAWPAASASSGSTKTEIKEVGSLCHVRETPDPFIDLTGQPGVLGRADRFVETSPQFAPLVERLLSRTWFVETLPQALALAPGPGRGLNYVTLAGDLLEADGTLTVGPRSVATGLISRRSQLRALQAQLAELESAIVAAQNHMAELNDQIASGQRLVDRRSAEHRRIVNALAENRMAIAAAEERRSQLDQQQLLLERELHDARGSMTPRCGCWTKPAGSGKRSNSGWPSWKPTRPRPAGRSTAWKADASWPTVRPRRSRWNWPRARSGSATSSRGCGSSRRAARNASGPSPRPASTWPSAAGGRWVTLEHPPRRGRNRRPLPPQRDFRLADRGLVGRRDQLQQQRTALAEQPQSRSRADPPARREDPRRRAGGQRNPPRTHRLADRLREDYGIELAVLEQPPAGQEQHQREEVQAEIEELRQKINNLGNVNLEALEELEQLEARYKTLSDQHADLSSAKASLEKIIERINADSRRLFSETLETVRGHFQTLFRDLFGGGQADLVLEENVDILDSGIDIVARPPGKELRSISLLSGGEKTMTCVALLLAIFRSHPSPFCVLDEVDAALDEANIDRFTKVLQDFLAWTQFIIVTHSKRTMTCASTLYGVTMQESGVTKQVSVRFEDVSDDGHILERPQSGDETQAA